MANQPATRCVVDVKNQVSLWLVRFYVKNRPVYTGKARKLKKGVKKSAQLIQVPFCVSILEQMGYVTDAEPPNGVENHGRQDLKNPPMGIVSEI